MLSRAFWSVLVASACAPGAARAQPLVGYYDGHTPVSGSRFLPPYSFSGYPSGGNPYRYGSAWPMSPPGVGAFPFFYVPRGFWPNGLSLYGAPVPTPGVVPGVFGNYDLARQWRAFPLYGIGAYGSLGIYSPGMNPGPGPRLRRMPIPYDSPLPILEGLASEPPGGAKVGGTIILSVRVPQPAAEVFVNGKRTTQTGTDRTFESPPAAGKDYTVTARWIERGQTVEVSKVVTGAPGEVVRVDFGR